MNEILRIRKKLNLTQDALGLLLGVTRNAISNYEVGYRKPRLEIGFQLLELATKYKIKTSLKDIYR